MRTWTFGESIYSGSHRGTIHGVISAAEAAAAAKSLQSCPTVCVSKSGRRHTGSQSRREV